MDDGTGIDISWSYPCSRSLLKFSVDIKLFLNCFRMSTLS